MKSYCGNVFPGPIVGDVGKEIRVAFISKRGSRYTGFHARFEFLNGMLKSSKSSVFKCTMH